MILPALPPFSLPAITRSHGWIGLVPFGETEPPGGITYVGQLASGRVVELLIQEAPDGVRVESDVPLCENEPEEVARMAEWMLGLRQDFSPFYAIAQEEPKLAKMEEQAQGRLLRSPTLFEDTVKTILTTNTSWAGTIRMVEALVSRFGSPLPSDPTRQAFPSASRLASADEETLRSEVRLGYRAPYVLGLACSVSSGTFDL